MARNIKVESMYPGVLMRLTYKNKIEYVFNQFISKTSVIAEKICKFKDITKKIIKDNGLTVVDGRVFKSNEYELIKKYAIKLSYPVIIKPSSQVHGQDVYTNIRNSEELIEKLKIFLNLKK